MCVNPIRIPNPKKDFDPRFDRRYIYVPCNHCHECVQQRQLDLETRGVSEFMAIKKLGGCVYAYSLTYSEQNVPKYCDVNVLCRRDIQLFKKRLKKRFGDFGDKFQVFYAGEYGHEHDRPHWHILIYCQWFIDPVTMADNVIAAWKQGFVGFCQPYVNGVRLVNNPRGSLLDNVDAIRYAMKYACKSYNFETYIYTKLRHWLIKNKCLEPGVSDDESFEFPQDDRFKFPEDQKLTLKYLTRYFGHCFRCPVGFGESQLNYLDDKWNMLTCFHDGVNYLKYHISKYLRNKLFNEIDENGITHKTKEWQEYMTKFYRSQAECNVDLIMANLSTPIFHHGAFTTVHEALEWCMNYAPSFDSGSPRQFLYNLFLYRNIYLGRADLVGKKPKQVFSLLRRRGFVPHKDPDFATLKTFEQVETVDGVIFDVLSELKYKRYLDNTAKYNQRQTLLSYQTGEDPRYLSVLPYEKYRNLKKLDYSDIKNNY